MDIVWYLLGKKAGSLKLPVIPPDAGTLESIVVGTLPTKTTYIEGESLDLTGVQILGNFSNGYQYDVTNGCTFICNDPVTYSDTKITVKYVVVDTEKTLDIPITVNGVPVPAPASTIALYHCDGNLVNAVTGNPTGRTYSASEGKFGAGQAGSTNAAYQGFFYANIDNARMVSSASTLEFWAKTTSTSSAYLKAPSVYTTSQENVTSDLFYQGANVTSGLRLYSDLASDYTKVYTPTSFDLREWHHFAVVFNNSKYTIFLDGKLCTTGNIKSGAFVQTLRVGNNMAIDEVLLCYEAKYVADFEPPHAAYYIPQGGE